MPSTPFDITADDAAIARALEDASIPTLMMSMIHMSGDASLLDGPLRPAGVYINEYQGYMTEEDKERENIEYGWKGQQSRMNTQHIGNEP